LDNQQLNFIVAYSKNRAIGRDNKLLWHLADDMAFFKKMTTNKVVIMGRKTYESLPPRFRPLPNRVNIVLSSQNPMEQKENLFWVRNIKETYQVLEKLDCKEVFVIGGGQIYDLFLPNSNTIYATEVDIEIKGDAFFPELNAKDWNCEVIESHSRNEKNDYSYQIVKFTRKQV
jgi:dihydrofolate reductase